MKTVILKPITEMANRLITHFGNEWVVNNDTGHSLVVSDLDESVTKIVRKRHDPHFEISMEGMQC